MEMSVKLLVIMCIHNPSKIKQKSKMLYIPPEFISQVNMNILSHQSHSLQERKFPVLVGLRETKTMCSPLYIERVVTG